MALWSMVPEHLTILTNISLFYGVRDTFMWPSIGDLLCKYSYTCINKHQKTSI